MIGQGNVTHLLVGKDLSLLGETKTRADLATGQLGVFKVGSKTAIDGTTDLTAGDRFTIATLNSKGVIVETPVIEYNNIKSKSSTVYAASTVRSRAIGFNGTSGSIDPINYANYVAHVFWKDNSKTFGQGIPVKFAAFAADGSATQAEIAAGLVNNFNKNFQREKPKLIKAEVLVNSAGSAVGAAADTVVGNIGSKYVTVTDTGGNTTVNAMVAGDYFRAGTAVTDPCYKVVASTVGTGGGILTLDTPLQAAVNLVGTTAELITAANAAAADCGVKLTGMPLTEGFEPGVIRWDFIDFEIQLGSEVGATTQSSITTPSLGSGTYYEVAQNEWFLKGNRGEAWRVGNYPKTVTLEATAGKTYDQCVINYMTSNAQTIDRQVASYGTVMIAVEAGSAGYTALLDVVNI